MLVFHSECLSVSTTTQNRDSLHSCLARLCRNIDQGNTPCVLTVRRVLDKAKIARLVLLCAFIAPPTGLLVGVCTRNVEAGIGIWVGILALGAFILSFAAWC